MIQSQSQTAAERKGVITWETETELMTRRETFQVWRTHTLTPTQTHTDETRDH